MACINIDVGLDDFIIACRKADRIDHAIITANRLDVDYSEGGVYISDLLSGKTRLESAREQFR